MSAPDITWKISWTVRFCATFHNNSRSFSLTQANTCTTAGLPQRSGILSSSTPSISLSRLFSRSWDDVRDVANRSVKSSELAWQWLRSESVQVPFSNMSPAYSELLLSESDEHLRSENGGYLLFYAIALGTW
eukprot:3086311-Rhodomonas_salina.2